MKIEAVLDSSYFRLGWDAHWKTLGWKRMVFPMLGYLSLALAIAQVVLIPSEYISTVMLLVIGLVFTFQSEIAAFHHKRSVLKHPNYGKTITLSLNDPYFEIKVGDSEAKLNLNEILKIESSKDVTLIYPQKGIYYIVPSDSFASQNTYNEFLKSIVGKYGAS
jgi:hypothetical protein